MGRRRPGRFWVCSLVCVALATAVTPAAAPVKGANGWFKLQTPNFTVLSNAGKRRTAKAAKNLERLREVLSITTAGAKMDSRIPTYIYFFQNDASFKPYKLGPDGEPMNVAGYYIGADDGNYLALDLTADPDSFTVVYHEYIHYVLHNNLPGLPLWLEEGMAEFYSTFKARDDEAEVGRLIRDHLFWLHAHPMIPLEDLFTLNTESPDYNEGDRQGTVYAQSWLLTHYLIAGSQERRAKLEQLTYQLRNGRSAPDAFASIYGMTLSELQAQLEAYLSKDELNLFLYTFQEDLVVAETSVEQLPRVDALYHLGDLLAHRAQSEAAERHAQEALELEPAHPGANAVLGFCHLLREQYEAAASRYGRAIELEPGNSRLYVSKAEAILAGFSTRIDPAEGLPPTAPAPVLEARELFRKALQMSPEDPHALAGLGNSFVLQASEVDEGLLAMSKAVRLLPTRKDLLANYIVLTARSGNIDGARSLLDRALRPAGGPGEVLAAEAGILFAAAQAAELLEQQGRGAEARSLVVEVAEATRSPELQELVSALIRQTRASGKTETEVDQFNRAVELANSGDAAAATELLESMAWSENAELRDEARQLIEELRRAEARRELVDRYNRAVELANQGKTEEAIDVLISVLSSSPDSELRLQARRLLTQLRD